MLQEKRKIPFNFSLVQDDLSWVIGSVLHSSTFRWTQASMSLSVGPVGGLGFANRTYTAALLADAQRTWWGPAATADGATTAATANGASAAATLRLMVVFMHGTLGAGKPRNHAGKPWRPL
jgi:hypothetical protein